MTALLKDWECEQHLTPEEYLAFEESSELKHEYFNGRVRAMAGASLEHNYITMNMAGELMVQLRGKRCAVFGSDKRLRIKPPHGTFYLYPDVTVDCSAQKDFETIAPSVLIEVASSSTRGEDEDDKLKAYLSLASLRVYAQVEQSAPRIKVHRRADDGSWRVDIVVGLEASLSLAEIGCTLPLRLVYDRVEFPRVQP